MLVVELHACMVLSYITLLENKILIVPKKLMWGECVWNMIFKIVFKVICTEMMDMFSLG